MGKLERNKGARYERHVANKLKRVFPDARRRVVNHAAVEDGVDLDGTGNLRVQVKKWKQYPPLSKIDEIKDGTGIPVFVAGANNREDLVVLPLDAFIRLLEDVGIAYDE